MVGLDHRPVVAPEASNAAQEARNTRIGLWLCALYSSVYAGFVAINAFRPDLMESTPVAGINVAVLYGFGLILGALVLSLTYGWLCHAPVANDKRTGGSA